MMNKMIKFFALAILAGTMASCSSDDSTPTIHNNQVAVQFNGGINVTTRAVDAKWTANDKIGIFMTKAGETLAAANISEGVDNVAYQTDGSNAFSPVSGGKTIYFPVSGNVDFYSYYPQTTVNNYKVALNVADQTNQEAIDFLYAKTAGCNKAVPQVTLTFNHQLANLILDVQPGDGLQHEDLANLTIKVKNQNTTATYNLADGTIEDAGTPADITMRTTTAGKKYEAILLPTTETSRVLEFDLNNGHNTPYVWTMPTKLEAGSKYHYITVKLSRTDVQASGTIEAWTEVKDNTEYIARPTGKFTINEGDDVTIKDYEGTAPIVVNGNATITLSNVKLNTNDNVMTINNGATVTLNIEGTGNELTSTGGAGIKIMESTTSPGGSITINGTGASSSKLKVTAAGGVAIGFRMSGAHDTVYGGDIKIKNITLEAQGGFGSPAIGLSALENDEVDYPKNYGKISIDASTLIVSSTGGAACVGTPYHRSSSPFTLDGIYISNSAITATAESFIVEEVGEKRSAACIGFGYVYHHGQKIIKKIEFTNTTLHLTTDANYKVGFGDGNDSRQLTDGIWNNGSKVGDKGWNP